MVSVIPPDNKSVLVDDDRRGDRGDRHGDDWYRPAERIKDEVNSSMLQVLERISQTVVAVERNGRSAELATEKTGAAGQLTTEKVGAAVATANASNFANTQNLMITGFKDGRYDSATSTASILAGSAAGFSAAALESCKQHADLAAKMAACCCELKEAIHGEGTDTRDLINAIDGRRADRDLVDAKNEVTMLKLQLSTLNGIPVARQG
jgi:hypothetical protein